MRKTQGAYLAFMLPPFLIKTMYELNKNCSECGKEINPQAHNHYTLTTISGGCKYTYTLCSVVCVVKKRLDDE